MGVSKYFNGVSKLFEVYKEKYGSQSSNDGDSFDIEWVYVSTTLTSICQIRKVSYPTKPQDDFFLIDFLDISSLFVNQTSALSLKDEQPHALHILRNEYNRLILNHATN